MHYRYGRNTAAILALRDKTLIVSTLHSIALPETVAGALGEVVDKPDSKESCVYIPFLFYIIMKILLRGI